MSDIAILKSPTPNAFSMQLSSVPDLNDINYLIVIGYPLAFDEQQILLSSFISDNTKHSDILCVT